MRRWGWRFWVPCLTLSDFPAKKVLGETRLGVLLRHLDCKVRTLRRDGGKVWLRTFPHSAGASVGNALNDFGTPRHCTLFCCEAITWRGKETRMGGGKGTIQLRSWAFCFFFRADHTAKCSNLPCLQLRYWVQAVRPGFILFEVDGCKEAGLPPKKPTKPILALGWQGLNRQCHLAMRSILIPGLQGTVAWSHLQSNISSCTGIRKRS